MGASKRRELAWALVLFGISFLIAPVQADEGVIRTSCYVFASERSTIVQTGGFAGVHWTYVVEGRFCLIVNPDTATARFERVDANAVDVSEPARTLDPNAVFNLTALAGAVADETIEFAGQTDDGSSVHLTLAFTDDTVHLIGQTTPPPNSADFFAFRIDAVAARKYAGGTGDPNTPYQIATAADLIALGETPEDYDKHFILTADIDLDPNLPGGRVFGRAAIAPDTNDVQPGFQGVPFTGVFDGKGHTIANFTCESENAYCAGLFGHLVDSTVRDLRLIDPNIQAQIAQNVGALAGINTTGTICGCSVQGGIVVGGEPVGGLVGFNNFGTIVNSASWCHVEGSSAGGLAGCNGGSILMCYSTGKVSGDEAVGGLVGHNGWRWHGPETWSYPGVVTLSYSTGAVTGSVRVGGLVGFNEVGTVEQCYSVGLVDGKENAGGLIGLNGNPADVIDCFWDVATSGTDFSDGGIGKTTAQMQDHRTFGDAGWDFIGRADGPDDFWAEPDGGGYPILWWQVPLLPELPFAGGSGEPGDPYLVATAEQLNSIGRNPRLMTVHFRLLNDIDAEGMEFFTIGDDLLPFEGTFDGNNHTISHLKIAGETYRGLIGVLASGGTVRGVSIADVNVTGTWNVGALVGFCDSGFVMDCHSTGIVRGSHNVGGLVGYSYDSHLLQCSSTQSVAGISFVGGLVGYSHESHISQCSSMQSVAGISMVGGLVGVLVLGDQITESYSTAAVQADNWVGGLVGRNFGSLTNCYAAGHVTGSNHVGGLAGQSGYGGRDIGERGIITNCYSTCHVFGTGPETGGLVGHHASGRATSSFWDIETSGWTTSPVGTGLTTAEMQTAATFLDAGWDFVGETANGTDDVWWILEGQDYPRLWWERDDEASL
ncbi:GLUG motif-containing protein [Anaerobaca lacustris]|uniref:GLUG motif-containing protein n=1 Tax=Anaerobaca lacustris TaxID=3044600 RepID=A0AAW6U3Q8_9BACT|nr:GLUG motif-containing protein [Sedimentisphaerales bacterium M17dextr]